MYVSECLYYNMCVLIFTENVHPKGLYIHNDDWLCYLYIVGCAILCIHGITNMTVTSPFF